MPLDETNAPEGTLDHVCARCLEPVAGDADTCSGCQASFRGCGRFLRLYAPRETRLDMARGASSRSWRCPGFLAAGSPT